MVSRIAVLALALALALHAMPAGAETERVRGTWFTFPMPAGYTDLTAVMRSTGFPREQIAVGVVSESGTIAGTRLILFQRLDIWGGNLGDPVLCRKSAPSVVSGGTVKSASIIAGPAGPTCQIHVVSPEGVAILTELVGAKETWLMTCNHAEGDEQAEKNCRATLAALELAPAFGRPNPAAVWFQIRLSRLAFLYRRIMVGK